MSTFGVAQEGRNRLVIGTAGHVDHGKSELVRALTGVHPDRLTEEKRRGLSIDLGFASMDLADGFKVGFVDVPGHIDFIENMLAGVGGIDAALLVVAADEGVMPQTREHLAILDLLDIRSGIVVLSKLDLAPGGEWVDLVRDDIRATVAGTSAETWPIVGVSSVTHQGLDVLKSRIEGLTQQAPTSSSSAAARLPIDRVFSISGFGTVATGTLLGGELRVDEQVELLPQGAVARIRGLETHHERIEVAHAGSRVAVNLSGVSTEQIERGDLLARPGTFRTTSLIDVQFRLLRTCEQPLRHNQELKIFVGPAQRMVRVRLLGGGEIEPGRVGFLQLLLDSPIGTYLGERYVLRRPSPAETIGGGLVLDPHPLGRHKLRDRLALKRLNKLGSPNPHERIRAWLAGRPPLLPAEIARLTGWRLAGVIELLSELEREGSVVGLSPSDDGRPRYLTAEALENRLGAVKSVLSDYHARHPLGRGIPKAELAERLGVELQVLDGLIGIGAAAGEFEQDGPYVKLAAHIVELTAKQEELSSALIDWFRRDPFSPPSVDEVRSQIGDSLYSYLKEQGRLVEVSSEVVFERQAYDRALERIRALVQAQGGVTVASLRDDLGSSRKYVLPLLEHLDARGVTVRQGDVRRLGKEAAEPRTS